LEAYFNKSRFRSFDRFKSIAIRLESALLFCPSFNPAF